jgi:tripartite-type tricarboxylate transporter receptor subunit TctC
VLQAGGWLVALAGCASALAQPAWPAKPITLMVTVAAGGSIDAIARVIGDELSRSVGQQVLVENRGGAAGNIAAVAVARAAPDGHTLLVSGTNLVLNPFLRKKDDTWVDPVKSLAPVALTARTNYVLVVGPQVKANTLDEFIAWARRQDGKLSFGSSGAGSNIHLATEVFNSIAEIRATHIPYKGLAPAVQDLLGGRIDYLFDSATAVEQVRGGRIRALAVVGPQPLAALPELKALSALGVRGMDGMSGWHGWFAPMGTPAETVRRINAEVTRIVAQPKVRERIAAQGAEPATASVEEFARRVVEDMQRVEPVIRRLGLSVY